MPAKWLPVRCETNGPAETVQRVWETCVRSPQKTTTHRASRELQMPQSSVWRILRLRLCAKGYRLHTLYSPSMDRTETVSSSIACSVVAGKRTCPQSSSLAAAVLLSPVYMAVTWQWVYMSQYVNVVLVFKKVGECGRGVDVFRKVLTKYRSFSAVFVQHTNSEMFGTSRTLW
jgi:hypothetical protein